MFLCNTTIFVTAEGTREHDRHAGRLRTRFGKIHRADAIVVDRCAIVVSIRDVAKKRF
jgi:hypothetical protein